MLSRRLASTLSISILGQEQEAPYPSTGITLFLDDREIPEFKSHEEEILNQSLALVREIGGTAEVKKLKEWASLD